MLGKIESEILVTHAKWVYFFINPPYEPLYPLHGKCNFKFPFLFFKPFPNDDDSSDYGDYDIDDKKKYNAVFTI